MPQSKASPQLGQKSCCFCSEAVEATFVEAVEAAVGVGGADLFVFRSSEAVRSLLKPRGSAKEEIKEMRITNRKTFLILHLCRQNGTEIVFESHF